nr:hypothetical protein [Bacteroides thetaiotaomicron]
MLTFIAMVGFRIQLILVYELLLNMLNKKNMHILIYGIDDKSCGIESSANERSHYKVVGFCISERATPSDAWLIFPFISFKMKSALTSLFIRMYRRHPVCPLREYP